MINNNAIKLAKAVTLQPIGVNITNIKMPGSKTNPIIAATAASKKLIPIIGKHLHPPRRDVSNPPLAVLPVSAPCFLNR